MYQKSGNLDMFILEGRCASTGEYLGKFRKNNDGTYDFYYEEQCSIQYANNPSINPIKKQTREQHAKHLHRLSGRRW